MSTDRFRTLKAVLKTALAWGVTLGVLSGVLISAYVFIVPGPGDHTFLARIQSAFLAGIGMGVRFAIGAAAIGTFFALALRFGFRGRRVGELSIPRSALVGAVVGGVGIPLFYQFMNLVSSGHTIAWNLVTDDAVWASAFGALAASGSIWLARRATALPAERETGELGAGDPRQDFARPVRSREELDRR